MVLRSSDKPTGVVESVADTQTQIESLARAQGRGSSALRGGSNVIEVNPDSRVPLLTPVGVDVGLGFESGTLQVVSGDGQSPRGLTAQSVVTTGGAYVTETLTADRLIAGNGIDCGAGSIHGVHTGSARLDTAYVGGALTANNIIAGGGADFGGGFVHGVHTGSANLDSAFVRGTLTADRLIAGNGADFGSAPVHGVHTGSANLDSAYVGGTVTAGKIVAGFGADFGGGNVNCFAVNANSLASRGADGGVNWDAGGALQVVNHNGTAFHGVYASNFALASDRALKEDIEHVERADAAELIRGLQPREFTWAGRPGRTVGFVAQEMPERLVARTSMKDEADVDTEMLGYDMSQLLAVAVATIQHQTQRLDDQQTQIDALTARVDRLERDTPSPIA